MLTQGPRTAGCSGSTPYVTYCLLWPTRKELWAAAGFSSSSSWADPAGPGVHQLLHQQQQQQQQQRRQWPPAAAG